MNTITHNLMSMNTQRTLRINEKKVSDSSIKLSSGYKINKSADDAAGLSISEKMRWQIRGLTKGFQNIQDGISLIQVADGALSEVHSILQRMNELAVQAANDTNTWNDRKALQHEVDSLSDEIDRIGKNTTFNNMHIFDDLYGDETVNVGNITKIISCSSANMGYLQEGYEINGRWYPASSLDFSNINENNIQKLNGKGFSFCCSQSCDEVFDFKFVTDSTPSSAANLTGKVHHYYTINISSCKTGAEVVDALFSFVKSHQPTGNGSGGLGAMGVGDLGVSHSNNMAKSPDGTKLTIYANLKIEYGIPDPNGYATEEEAKNAYPLKHYGTSQSGAIDCSDLTRLRDTSSARHTFNIQCSSSSRNNLKIQTHMMNADILAVNDLFVLTSRSAEIAMKLVAAAIDTISEHRSDLGANQNRLEHSYNNVTNEMENVQASESRIRDTDMAEEMTEYAKHKILMQTGQAMLMQTNQNNSTILKLLQ